MMPSHFSSIAGYRFVALTSISRRPWVEDVCFALAGPGKVPLFTAHTEARFLHSSTWCTGRARVLVMAADSAN